MDYVVALGHYGHLNNNISNPWAQDTFILMSSLSSVLHCFQFTGHLPLLLNVLFIFLIQS